MRSKLVLPAVLLLISCTSCHNSVKTARHAYSASSSGSNSFASSFASSGGGSGTYKVGVANDFTGNPAFWWVGPNSPFQDAYEFFRKCSSKGNCGNIPAFVGVPANLPNNLPENGCNDNGCSFSGSFNLNDKSGDYGPIDISKNPFLNGEFQGVSFSSCSGNACPGGKPHSTITTTNCKGSDCKTNTQHGGSLGEIDISKNPFLSGGFTGVKGGHAGGSAGCSGAGGCSGTSGTYGFVSQGQFGFGSGSSSSQPGQIGGCGGVKGGCGSSGGTFTQQSGQTGGCAPGKVGCGSSGGTFVQPGQIGGGSFVGTAVSQQYPGQTSGCAGGKTGCGSSGGTFVQQQYPGQQPGQIGGGAGTFVGTTVSQQYPGQTGGCSPGKAGCGPSGGTFIGGQQGGGYSGSSSGSFSGSNVHVSYPNQGSGQFPGSTPTGTDGSRPNVHVSYPNQGSSQTTGTQTTGSGQNVHVSHPDQGSGQFGGSLSGVTSSGSTSFSGSSSGSSQGGFTQTGSTYPSGLSTSQPNYPQHGQTVGSTSYSGSSSGSFSSTGFTSSSHHTTGTISGTGSGTTSGTFNQPGYTTSQQLPSSSGSFSGSGSYSGSGSFAGTGSYQGTGQTTPSGNQRPGGSIQGDLTIKCYGSGLICVKKHLCNNGIVNTNGDGLIHQRDGDNYCDVATETCCKLPNKSGVPHTDHQLQIPNVQGGQTYYQSTKSHQGTSGTSSTTYFQSRGTSPAGVNDYRPTGQFETPGVQVYPDGQTGTKTQAPSLVRPVGSNQTPQGGLLHYGPGEAPALKTTPNTYEASATTPKFTYTLKPGTVDVTNELSFASTIKGPAYLPPDSSPTPSAGSYTPDLLPPERSTPRTYPSTQTQTTFYQTPKPTTYYPTQKPTNNIGYYPTQKPTTGYLPPVSTTKKPQVTNGYLPPYNPSATSGSNQYLPPLEKEQPDSNIININVLPTSTTKKPYIDRVPLDTNTQGTFLRPSTPRSNDFGQNTTPYPGCAAALKCVQFDFCTAEGVISTSRVSLTPEQEANRVPLTDCQDLETGLVGKCCRDPDYKDPWPSTQLGLFNPDQDFQGSNPRPQGGVKGVKGGVKGGRRPYNPFEPNQIGSPSNNPNAVVRPGGYPRVQPEIPFDSRLVNVPVQVEAASPIEQRIPVNPVRNPGTCGVRHPDSSPRGPGPIDAAFAEIPWQAMILRDTNRSLLCGGAIIRPDVVLTAAHCVENLESNDVLVKGGEWKLGIDEEPKPFQINKVATIVRHPGYRPDNRFNDIALLILKEKFRLDKNVDTLCLLEPQEDVVQKFENSKCITTGWGKTILQLHVLNSLMHILGVGVLPGGQCQQQLQQHSNSAHLYNTNCVCGVPVTPQANICDVDIGSALACEGPDGRYTLAGIYSWDTGCNPTAQVAGYTKVDTQWVHETLKRPLNDLKTEERGFYQQLQGQDCHCIPGK